MHEKILMLLWNQKQKSLKNNLHIFVLLLLLVSCRKDKPPIKPSNGEIIGAKRVWVLNEGNFGTANASYSLYDPSNGNLIQNCWTTYNTGNLGDVLQSISKIGNRYYLVLNNSSKIAIINGSTFQKEGEINGLISPRYLLQVSNNKAYVSNLKLNGGTNYIQIIDLNSHSVTGSIQCNGWTENMILSYGKVFVSNPKKNYIYIIDTQTDQLTDSIYTQAPCTELVKDKDEKIWAIRTEQSAQGILPALLKLNPLTKTIESALNFSNMNETPLRLKINGSGDKLYYLNPDLHQLPVNASSLTPTLTIPQGNMNFYALGIDPVTDEIYIGDAIDFNQNGTVMRYQPSGNFHSSFKVGIIPGAFYFE